MSNRLGKNAAPVKGQSDPLRLQVPPGKVYLKPGIPHSMEGSELTPVCPKWMSLAPARLYQVTASCAPRHQNSPEAPGAQGLAGERGRSSVQAARGAQPCVQLCWLSWGWDQGRNAAGYRPL